MGLQKEISRKAARVMLPATFCWWLAACGPAGTGQPPVIRAADTVALETQVDSAHQVNQDGLDYAPLNTGTYQQLPPALSQLLQEQYPGWVLPPLAAAALRAPGRDAQGPYYVQADFDQNGVADYAVQFLAGDTIRVVAYLGQAGSKPRPFVLLRQPAVLVKGEKQSPLTIGPESAGAGHRGPAGLVIGRGRESQVAVFQQGRFVWRPQGP